MQVTCYHLSAVLERNEVMMSSRRGFPTIDSTLYTPPSFTIVYKKVKNMRGQHTCSASVCFVVFFYFGIGGLVKVVDDYANSHSSL